MAIKLGPRTWWQRILITKAFVAETIIPKLIPRLSDRDDILALAITGSYTRGDFADGSDLDFWVIGQDNKREDFSEQGLDISLLFTSTNYAKSLDCAMRFELEQVQIIYDPSDLMKGIVRQAKEKSGSVKKTILHSASQVFHELAIILDNAQTTDLKIATLRETARRAAALFIYRSRGLRVPKWRHFAKIMFTENLNLLEQISHFDDVNMKKLTKIFKQTLHSNTDYPLPDSEQIDRYLQHQRSKDAFISLRKALPPRPYENINKLHGSARQLFDSAHAFEQLSTTSQQVLLIETKQQTRQLMQDLGIENSLSGSRVMFALLDSAH